MKARIAVIALGLVCLSALFTACGKEKMDDMATTVKDALTTIKDDIESGIDDLSEDAEDMLPDASNGIIEDTTVAE
ncbi:MAG TPA: hypothetical protein DDY98_04250 [Ruminococcaceae bacterium]|nr:hypothetical protein [Oscillospiraceae bacterium]